jgi:hypothetical protein
VDESVIASVDSAAEPTLTYTAHLPDNCFR